MRDWPPRGRKGGRPAQLGGKEIREIKALLRDLDVRVTDMARRYGVGRATAYNAVGVVQPKRSAKVRAADSVE